MLFSREVGAVEARTRIRNFANFAGRRAMGGLEGLAPLQGAEWSPAKWVQFKAPRAQARNFVASAS